MSKKEKPNTQDIIPQYNQLVKSLKIHSLKLIHIDAQASTIELDDLEMRVKHRFNISYSNISDSDFIAKAQLSLHFLSEEEELGYFHCTYAIHYSSDAPMTDEIFEVFSRRNVPLNIWPYLREMAMSMTQKFGWSGFVLPPFKAPSVTLVLKEKDNEEPNKTPASKPKKDKKPRSKKKV